MKTCPKIFLLNLLDDNNSKQNYIKEANCGQELVQIYLGLNNQEEIETKTDFSQVTDYQLKELIIKHPALTKNQDYLLSQKESNLKLKERSFHKYLRRQRFLFNPMFFYQVVKSNVSGTDLIPWKSVIMAAWQALTISTILSFSLSLWWVPVAVMVSLSSMWWLFQKTMDGALSEFIEMTGTGLFLVFILPVLIPLGIILVLGIVVMLYSENISHKLFPHHKKVSDDEPYFDYHNYPPRF